MYKKSYYLFESTHTAPDPLFPFTPVDKDPCPT